MTAMATQSLYRRYRPRRFSEVKGQDHVVRALRTAVAEGREGQAYLFSGPRGTGKTSSARILAKVLNCENPQDGEPCCECESCLAVERGTSYDVHELDAASNNGVDAMRDLIEKASLGTPGRHKVYILDEVHMLSKAAEAALLKTLEEPPPHVVFVLATTDPQKMSDTIRSRTQHLQFHLLPADTLQEHVRWVAADAGLDVSDAALDQALQRGGGSARDTLSALELVANTGEDGLDVVPLDEFVEAMIDRDPGRALTVVAHAIAAGSDTRTLTEELIAFLRNGFLSLMAPDLVQLPSARVDEFAAQAQRLGAAGLVRGVETLGSTLTEMRHAPDPRVLLDVAAVQLTADAAASDVDALVARIERLERQLAEGGALATPRAASSPVDPATGRAALGGRARSAAAATGSATAAASTAAPASTATGAARPATARRVGRLARHHPLRPRRHRRPPATRLHRPAPRPRQPQRWPAPPRPIRRPPWPRLRRPPTRRSRRMSGRARSVRRYAAWPALCSPRSSSSAPPHRRSRCGSRARCRERSARPTARPSSRHSASSPATRWSSNSSTTTAVVPAPTTTQAATTRRLHPHRSPPTSCPPTTRSTSTT